MFLLDTNVVSDPMGRNPSPALAGWLAVQSSDMLYLSAASAQEIEYGIARLDPSRRRMQLRAWWDALVADYQDRLLPVDVQVALAWGQVRARAEAEKRTIPEMDAVLAATAQVHGLTLVTRNVRHFTTWGGPVFNPWDDA